MENIEMPNSSIKNHPDADFTKVEKIICNIGIESYLLDNEQKLYNKISQAYIEAKNQQDDDIRFNLLLEKIRGDINEIVLNYTLVSPLKLKHVVDEIIEKNESDTNNRKAKHKAVITIFMAIVYFIVSTQAKYKKNKEKTTTDSLTKLINRYVQFNKLSFG